MTTQETWQCRIEDDGTKTERKKEDKFFKKLNKENEMCRTISCSSYPLDFVSFFIRSIEMLHASSFFGGGIFVLLLPNFQMPNWYRIVSLSIHFEFKI